MQKAFAALRKGLKYGVGGADAALFWCLWVYLCDAMRKIRAILLI